MTQKRVNCDSLKLCNGIHRTPQTIMKSHEICGASVFINRFPSNPMHTVHIDTGYKFEELQQELARVREGGMPRTTLYGWLRRLKIIPGIDGFYTEEDLQTLKALNRFLKQCPSIAKFEKAYFSQQ
jgi:hypothetical protein